MKKYLTVAVISLGSLLAAQAIFAKTQDSQWITCKQYVDVIDSQYPDDKAYNEGICAQNPIDYMCHTSKTEQGHENCLWTLLKFYGAK